MLIGKSDSGEAAPRSENEDLKVNRLLWQIRKEGGFSTRFKLAQVLRISNSRVCDLVQDMVDRGMLLEECNGTERRGRKGAPLRVNPEFAYFVGFDMEAKRLRLCVSDFAGGLVWDSHKKFVPPKGRAPLIKEILDFIGNGLERARSQFPTFAGIGLAANGIIDARRGVILHYDLVEGMRDLPLRDLVADRFALPCCMENNIRALTLAEGLNGAGRHFDTFICLGVRSGIGAGIVINGKLYVGRHGFAAEPGYSPVPTGSDANEWKQLQRIVSETALGVDAEASDFSLSPTQAKRCGELLGGQLAGMASLLDPQAIVLAGALVQPDRPLWDHIVRTFRRHVLPDLVDCVQIVPAQLGPFAAALGAAHRCFEMLYPRYRAPIAGANHELYDER